MKILLTGEPKSGKSTIVNAFKRRYSEKTVGIVTHAVLDDHGIRKGFEAENSQGEKQLFAKRNETPSPASVGKFHVDPSVIDEFFVPELEKGFRHDSPVVLLDEIGRMQSMSQNYLTIVGKLIESEVNLLGTIVNEDEPWSLPFKHHPSVTILKVTIENRNELVELLVMMFTNAALVERLTTKQQELVNTLLHEYAKANMLMQIKKLFNNAVPYVLDEKIVKESENHYVVHGHTKSHVVTVKNSDYSCDCDLFNGRTEYHGFSGICSHIQTVMISRE